MLKARLSLEGITTTVANQAERLNPNPPPVFRSICIDSERIDFHFRSLVKQKSLESPTFVYIPKLGDAGVPPIFWTGG